MSRFNIASSVFGRKRSRRGYWSPAGTLPTSRLGGQPFAIEGAVTSGLRFGRWALSMANTKVRIPACGEYDELTRPGADFSLC